MREYAFGTSPVTATTTATAAREPVPALTATHCVFRYQRDTALTDLTFTPQASSDGKNWFAPGEAGAPAGFTEVVIGTSAGIETREARIPRSAGHRFLCRIRVVR